GRSGTGMASGSPSSGPETTSSHNAVSATRRDTQPATLSACQWTGSGVNGTRPRWVFNPTRPLQEAGIRIEPPPSVADATLARPAATAAPEPPLDPPGVSSGLHGLRVTPKDRDSVHGKIASYDMCVFPITIASA